MIPINYTIAPFLTMGLYVVGPVGLVGLWVWWWARGSGGPLGLVGFVGS